MVAGNWQQDHHFGRKKFGLPGRVTAMTLTEDPRCQAGAIVFYSPLPWWVLAQGDDAVLGPGP